MAVRLRLGPRLMWTLRWLMGVERSAPELSEPAVQAFVARNYRWNFGATLVDGVFYSLGDSFIAASTVLPLFVSKLTDSPLPIGLLAVIAQGAWYVPQLFTANRFERLARMQPVVARLGFFTERLPLVMMACAPLLANRSPTLAVTVLLLGFAWRGLGSGVVAAAWQDMIARCFYVAQRGRLLGVALFAGGGVAMLGAGLSAWILKAFPFPTNFTYLFSLAAIGFMLSWVGIVFTREAPQRFHSPRLSTRQHLASLPALLRQDQNFKRFLIARMLMALGGMGTGFLTVAAVNRWAVSDATVGLYTAVLLIGQTFGTLGFGLLADRQGHKIALELGALAAMLSFALAALAPVPAIYFGVFALAGIAYSAVLVAGVLMIMEFGEAARRPTYVGIANTAVGAVGLVAPLLGAALAQLNYVTLFAASATVQLAALILFRWWVREPRFAGVEEATTELQI